MILAAVGMPGAGKSVLGERMKAKGVPLVYFGGIVLAEVRRRGLELTPDNERSVREDLRQKHGMDAMAKLALPELRPFVEAGQAVVIDGLYSFSEYRTLKQAFGETLHVVAICCDRATRHGRLAARSHRPLTAEEAELRDLTEIEKLEKGGPIALADSYILNDADLETFTARVDELADRLLGL